MRITATRWALSAAASSPACPPFCRGQLSPTLTDWSLANWSVAMCTGTLRHSAVTSAQRDVRPIELNLIVVCAYGARCEQFLLRALDPFTCHWRRVVFLESAKRISASRRRHHCCTLSRKMRAPWSNLDLISFACVSWPMSKYPLLAQWLQPAESRTAL